MSILNNAVIFSQIVSFKKKFHNEELCYLGYFFKLTQIEPVNIIIQDNFVFFLVKSEEYHIAKAFLKRIRRQLKHYKVLVIREEMTLLRMIFSFFPDTYIHDIQLVRDLISKNIVITLFFILDLDRSIAVGNKGRYINIINYIFNNALNFPLNSKSKIKIQCKRLFL
ncbi:MAG: hypothetical protein EU531_03155 [Promethearchaeota archaeon]|nr:MAG: hypothetical protein EU531_03155 [Candidatus Lokiarchaeota archaeon]